MTALPGDPVRPGRPEDLAAIAAIQQACPEASQWNVTEYLQYDLRVFEAGGKVAGFLVARTLAEGEREVLNLAVDPQFRRRGAGRALLESLLGESFGAVYLEVRKSNRPAREFYKSLKFQEITERKSYYETTAGFAETAIVMKFHSC